MVVKTNIVYNCEKYVASSYEKIEVCLFVIERPSIQLHVYCLLETRLVYFRKSINS